MWSGTTGWLHHSSGQAVQAVVGAGSVYGWGWHKLAYLHTTQLLPQPHAVLFFVLGLHMHGSLMSALQVSSCAAIAG
mgnify:CR=1 FL=1